MRRIGHLPAKHFVEKFGIGVGRDYRRSNRLSLPQLRAPVRFSQNYDSAITAMEIFMPGIRTGSFAP
jgi:hypothetical protein